MKWASTVFILMKNLWENEFLDSDAGEGRKLNIFESKKYIFIGNGLFISKFAHLKQI